MKTARIVNYLFSFISIALVCGCDFIGNQREVNRIDAVFTRVVQKLDACKKETGKYPDSLAALTFTNSPAEIKMLPDIEKISYERTQSGYKISYGGADGYRKSEEFSDER